MQRVSRNIAVSLVVALATGWGAPVLAQQMAGGEMLPDDAVGTADVSALQKDADLFEGIREGMALSLARCESDQSCSPQVSREEVTRIIDKIRDRLDVLTTRHTQTGNTALEPVLISYADIRDEYSKMLDKLKTLAPEKPAAPAPVNAPIVHLPKAFDVFEDNDVPLNDDAQAAGKAASAKAPAMAAPAGESAPAALPAETPADSPAPEEAAPAPDSQEDDSSP